MSTTERKYRKQLSQDNWKVKIQKWTWREATPSFVGYCPFFWFTWFCIILLPITLIVKLVGAMLRLLVSALPERVRKITRPDNAALATFNEWLLEGYTLDDLRNRTERGELGQGFERIFAWIDATPDWQNCVQRAWLNREKRKQREAAAAPKRAALARRTARFSPYIVKPLLVSVALLVVCWVGPSVARCAYTLWLALISLTWPGIVELLKAAGVLGAAFLVLYFLVLTVGRIIDGFRGCPKCPEKITWAYRLGSVFERGAEFIADTVGALYTSECPLIEWADRTGPIEPRRNDHGSA